MQAFDFEAVVYDGEIYCVNCLPDGVDVESDEVSPVFADSEWDYYPVCAECGAVHDYVNLTAEGRRIIRERAMREATGRILLDFTVPKTPFDINNGYCQEWAEYVREELERAGEDVEVEETPVDYDASGHFWLKIDNRYYDAECLDGVTDWKLLPIFMRQKH